MAYISNTDPLAVAVAAAAVAASQQTPAKALVPALTQVGAIATARPTRVISDSVAQGGKRAEADVNAVSDQMAYKSDATVDEWIGGLVNKNKTPKTAPVSRDYKRHGPDTACGSEFTPVTVYAH